MISRARIGRARGSIKKEASKICISHLLLNFKYWKSNDFIQTGHMDPAGTVLFAF